MKRKQPDLILPVLLIASLSASFSYANTGAETGDKPAKDVQQIYKLNYLEREQGMDEYEVVMLVSDRYIRVDQVGDESGYILYDDKDKIILSVSHPDKSILVIKQFPFDAGSAPVKHEIEYLELADAPTVSGNPVFNYRVFTGDGEDDTCTEVQLVENLMPEVRSMLKNYQMIVSGQQVKLTDNKINEYQTPCYFVDQIYNSGAYYEKGLPIQEWHSNDRSRILTSYKKVPPDSRKFTIPENYRRFSIDKDSKMQLQH